MNEIPITGRNKAYVLRNRISILKMTQEVLAQLGDAATINDVAERTKVSVSTIYKHFTTKDSLFKAALVMAVKDWESWAIAQTPASVSGLEKLVIPMRLSFRIQQTHALYAQLAKNNLPLFFSHLEAIGGQGLLTHVKSLIMNGQLEMDEPELRVSNLQGVLIKILGEQLLKTKSRPAEGDLALRIALSMLKIPDTQAGQLTLLPLPKSLNIT